MCSCKFMPVTQETLTLHKSDYSDFLTSLHPVWTATDPWRPYEVTVSRSSFFLLLNFVSRFPIGCLLTLLISNRPFKVKTLNLVSSLATNDLTFATTCCGLCALHTSVLPIVLNVSIPFKTYATVICPIGNHQAMKNNVQNRWRVSSFKVPSTFLSNTFWHKS